MWAAWSWTSVARTTWSAPPSPSANVWPPFGRKLFTLPLYLEERGITSITWDVAPETWDDTVQATEEIVQDVLNRTRPGSIVLLHVMYASRKNTMAAVPEVIRGLKGKGYRFVTVSELLAYRDSPPLEPGR